MVQHNKHLNKGLSDQLEHLISIPERGITDVDRTYSASVPPPGLGTVILFSQRVLTEVAESSISIPIAKIINYGVKC